MNRIINLIVIGSVVLVAADPVSKAMKEEKYKAAEHKERVTIKQEERETEKKGSVFKETSITKKSYPRGTIETH